MRNILKMLVMGSLLLFLSIAAVSAEEVTSQQIKGLDEQVQEIKSDVLAIAADLNQLEERLLYPSHTQMSIFISLAENESFRLDAIEILMDGEVVAEHIYTFKELEALRKGGVQRIYTGNVETGNHDLQVAMVGQSKLGGEIREEQSFQVEKDVRPGIAELILAQGSITLKNR